MVVVNCQLAHDSPLNVDVIFVVKMMSLTFGHKTNSLNNAPK